MSEDVPEYAVPRFESGFLLENAIYCSPLLTDKQTGRKRQSSTSPEDLLGEGGWSPPLSVVFSWQSPKQGVFRLFTRTDPQPRESGTITRGAAWHTKQCRAFTAWHGLQLIPCRFKRDAIYIKSTGGNRPPVDEFSVFARMSGHIVILFDDLCSESKWIRIKLYG